MTSNSKLLALSIRNSLTKKFRRSKGAQQDLDIYHDEDFASFLDEWGNGTVWNEVQMFLNNRNGAVLDLACGTGRTWDFLRHNCGLEYFGYDISSTLIDRAIKRGIESNRLLVGDATNLPYANNQFDYVFSIGSLEHFTLEGISLALHESNRVCSGMNFHLLPISRFGLNEGWLENGQSYWLNNKSWWINQFRAAFGGHVSTIESTWSAPNMRGIWFITVNPDCLSKGGISAG